MEIVFLGTGSAWCTPEHSCDCAICLSMRSLGEHRSRTCLLVRNQETILVDCGPDIRSQMAREGIDRRPDLILITHEHADHFIGLDDLLAFRRSMPPDAWTPVPVYATEQTWKAIEVRFGYLLDSLIERRLSIPGQPLKGSKTRITPFKTLHGSSAAGSVGYVLEEQTRKGSVKLVYTSDFMGIETEPHVLMHPDILIIQSHWLNEPIKNRPSHMSFQAGLEYIKKWKARKATYLVHISDGDQVPGDSCNNYLKKIPPKAPLADPYTLEPYPVPLIGAEWQQIVDKVCHDYDVPGPVIVPGDGTRVSLE